MELLVPHLVRGRGWSLHSLAVGSGISLGLVCPRPRDWESENQSPQGIGRQHLVSFHSALCCL